ncbi:MAG: hypothetical protein QM664_10170 [Flavihumibacter sp.]
MKKIVFFLSLVLVSWQLTAQEKSLKELVAKGNKAYVEFVDVKHNIPEAKEAINKALLGPEWNYWELVDAKDKADFILKVSVEKKGMNIMSMTSDGARIRVTTQVLSPNEKPLWKSKEYQGNASMFTGFAALEDAMRKMVRRALGEELMKNVQ